MKNPTLLRLAKEARTLLPLWGMTLLAIIAPFFLLKPWSGPQSWSIVAYCLGAALLSATCFGHEFTHRTMGLLLSQPLPRARIWLEKMIVLGVMLFGIMFFFFLVAWRYGLPENGGQHDVLATLLLIVAPAAIGFCTGPTLTLLVRNALLGTALIITGPIALMVLALGVASMRYGPDEVEKWMPNYTLVAQSIYCLCLLPLGFQLFRRLQDSNAMAQELSLPAKFAAPFKSLPEKLTLGRRGPVASLIRRELRLQQPTFLVALMIVVVWLCLIIIKIVHSRFPSEALFMTPFMLGMIGIPAVAGILSVAEERNMGLHDWHLTLPISARRQWLVKTAMTLLISMTLGVVLPTLLSKVSFWQFGSAATNVLENFQMFPWVNLVLTSLALYASTFSANSLRALVATGILGMAIGSLLTFLLGSISIHLGNAAALRIVFVLLYLAFELGLVNFRRAAGSIWAPVRQVALLCAAMIVLFCVSNL